MNNYNKKDSWKTQGQNKYRLEHIVWATLKNRYIRMSYNEHVDYLPSGALHGSWAHIDDT